MFHLMKRQFCFKIVVFLITKGEKFMFRKSIITASLLTVFFILEVKAQTTITIYSSSTSSIVRYKNENNQNTFAYTSLYQVGRKDG